MKPDSAFISRPVRRRGEPLIVLAMLMGGWIAVRAMLWEGVPLVRATPLDLPGGQPLIAARAPSESAVPALAVVRPARAVPGSPAALPVLGTAISPPPALVAQPVVAPPLLAEVAPQPPLPGVRLSEAGLPARPLRAQVASAHALLWMAAVSQLPLLEDAPLAAAAPPRAAPPRLPRWSGDGWLLLRGGGQGFGPAGSLPTYGASQLGAVLRYRLDAGASPFRPVLYARASGALSGPAGTLGEREAAIGLSARPLPGVPARIMVETRVSRFASGVTRLRPAASVVSELAPVTLPLATRAEFYAQAGYVGGPAATAFVDGQFRLDRQIARLGPAELRGGAGAWGGAQTGSGRLDVGPGLTLHANSGVAAARLAMDWRFRVAGNASPASGPALTLSAGF
jgi:hypothetical protein